MTPAYLLTAKRDPDCPGGLKIGYPTKEHAIAAVEATATSAKAAMIDFINNSFVLG